MPAESITYDLNVPKATYSANGLPMPDYTDFVNSLEDGPSVDGHVSFNIVWRDVIDEVRINGSNNQGFGGSDWGGHFFVTKAKAWWKGHQPGFSFQSDPGDTSEPVFAFLGKERNGIFFP